MAKFFVLGGDDLFNVDEVERISLDGSEISVYTRHSPDSPHSLEYDEEGDAAAAFDAVRKLFKSAGLMVKDVPPMEGEL